LHNNLLIVIDSLTRNNGAHVATRAMIAALRKRGVSVDLLLGLRTDDVEGIEDVSQYELQEPKRGFRWLVSGVCRRMKLAPVPRWVMDPWGKARRLMRQYDTILVVGENSHFRYLVSGVKGPRKVVFVHNDYVVWKTSCGWAIEDARFDRLIYRGFDVVAVVGQPNADRFAAHYPEFASKTRAFHNLFYFDKNVLQKRNGNSTPQLQLPTTTKIVTISRVEWGLQKMTDRIVRVAGELKRRGCVFDWSVYGRGSVRDEEKLKELAKKENVNDKLHFVGYTNNPLAALAQSDVHVLLSAFEGVPNVIFEAQMLGVPCISTDVGAVREMIEDGKTGIVLPQDENVVVGRLEYVLKNSKMLSSWKRNLIGYHYDNDKVLGEYREILNVAYGN